MLEDKIREAPFFKGSIWENIGVLYLSRKITNFYNLKGNTQQPISMTLFFHKTEESQFKKDPNLVIHLQVFFFLLPFLDLLS